MFRSHENNSPPQSRPYCSLHTHRSPCTMWKEWWRALLSSVCWSLRWVKELIHPHVCVHMCALIRATIKGTPALSVLWKQRSQNATMKTIREQVLLLAASLKHCPIKWSTGQVTYCVPCWLFRLSCLVTKLKLLGHLPNTAVINLSFVRMIFSQW